MDQIVLEFLNDRSDGTEAASVRTYRVYIGSREVTVEVQDGGPDAGSGRYSVAAYFSDIPEVDRHAATQGYSIGNPDGDLVGALHNVHWWEFDRSDD